MMTQPTAIIKRSSEFVEHQMHLFVGKLMRGRVAGQSIGNPKLNFGSFAIDFESELQLKDGEVATFRILSLSKNHITLGFIRREGGPEAKAVEENLTPKVKALLTELKLPVDAKHTEAAKDLLRTGYQASRENIRLLVTLDAKPGGETEASRIVEGLLHRGNDIPPKLLEALRVYIGSRPAAAVMPEDGFTSPSVRELVAAAIKLPGLRNLDDLSVNMKILTERVAEGLKPVIARSPEEIVTGYKAIASTRAGATSALSRIFAHFIPRYIEGLHPNDAVRVTFEQFQTAVREQLGIPLPTGQATSAATTGGGLSPLPIEVMPAFIEFMLSNDSTKPLFEQMMQAFSRTVQDALTPTSAGESPTSSALLNMIRSSIGANLGRLVELARASAGSAERSAGIELVELIGRGAESFASKLEGSRIAEWLLTPSRPGAENQPAVGFSLPDEVKGSISLHPGVKRHGDEEDEVPSGGRLVYEGEGVGRIEIGLEYSSDGLSAMFRVEREDTSKEIIASLPELAERLVGRGVKVKSLRAIHIRSQSTADVNLAQEVNFPEGGLDLKA